MEIIKILKKLKNRDLKISYNKMAISAFFFWQSQKNNKISCGGLVNESEVGFTKRHQEGRKLHFVKSYFQVKIFIKKLVVSVEDDKQITMDKIF